MIVKLTFDDTPFEISQSLSWGVLPEKKTHLIITIFYSIYNLKEFVLYIYFNID